MEKLNDRLFKQYCDLVYQEAGINLTEVSKDKIKVFKDKDNLRICFDYHLEYTPKLATINMSGVLLFAVDSSKSDQIISSFKKNKKLDKELQILIYNIIFQKCNIKALQLEEQIGLPPHLQMPRITSK